MTSCDVAIIGGGPAGSTAASVLMKYAPSLRVVVLERESFPRDHVGESQLPMIAEVLDEIGAWEKVEAANFPVKIGATYRWGRSDALWDFEFVPGVDYDDPPRPAKYEGQRARTAWQVDRSVYDDILLRHSEELGAEVRQKTRVREVLRDDDRVTGLQLDDETCLQARWYVDASGSSGVLRRAMGVEVEAPTQLRNIAIWDYWQDAEWAVTLGNGGTRIQVMSLGWGWMWFIPISPTRTSVGLVIPSEHFKSLKTRPSELYDRAISEEPRIAELLRHATREGRLASTKDWSYWSDRATGENWFLTGEALGFADPILSAGMTLAHTSGREAAYCILEADRGSHDVGWLRETYGANQMDRLRSHIKFAEFWYSANGIFTDLQAYTSQIARDAGLELNAQDAFRWLSTGGFTSDTAEVAQIATWDVTSMKILAQQFCGDEATWDISENNLLDLDLSGATLRKIVRHENGRIVAVKAYVRAGRKLPQVGPFLHLTKALLRERKARQVIEAARRSAVEAGEPLNDVTPKIVQALEAMVVEGWVKASFDSSVPSIQVRTPNESMLVHQNRDPVPA